jgi:hypothetical protein
MEREQEPCSADPSAGRPGTFLIVGHQGRGLFPTGGMAWKPPTLREKAPQHRFRARAPRLHVLEIGGVNALGEPAVARGEQMTRVVPPALLRVQAIQAHAARSSQNLADWRRAKGGRVGSRLLPPSNRPAAAGTPPGGETPPPADRPAHWLRTRSAPRRAGADRTTATPSSPWPAQPPSPGGAAPGPAGPGPPW